jgi:hypothetical protein
MWRVGRSVGRTIYEQTDKWPSKSDPLLGMMDSIELAQRAVNAVNIVDQLMSEREALLTNIKALQAACDAKDAEIIYLTRDKHDPGDFMLDPG